MYKNFLPSNWIFAVRQILLDIESDGKLERTYTDQNRISGLLTLSKDSLVKLNYCSASYSSLMKTKDYYTMPIMSLYHKPLGDWAKLKADKVKAINSMAKKINSGENKFLPEEFSFISDGSILDLIGSITITVSEEQKTEMTKKLADYADAFMGDYLFAPGGHSVVSYQNHKYAFVKQVEELAKTQPVKNMLMEEKTFHFAGWHFLEMIFALEKEQFIKIIELNDNDEPVKLIVSSNQPGKKYVRFAIMPNLSKYYQKNFGKTEENPSPEGDAQQEPVKNKKPLGENLLLAKDLRLDRKTGDFERSKHKKRGRLTATELKLIVTIEKYTRQHGRIMESQLMKELGYKARQKAAFNTLVSKTRTELNDQDGQVICAAQNYEVREKEFSIGLDENSKAVNE